MEKQIKEYFNLVKKGKLQADLKQACLYHLSHAPLLIDLTCLSRKQHGRRHRVKALPVLIGRPQEEPALLQTDQRYSRLIRLQTRVDLRIINNLYDAEYVHGCR